MKKRKGIAAFFVVTLLLVIPALNAQTTWYVDDDAPNDPGPGDPSVSDPLADGSSGHPFDAIQEGIDTASNGDTVLVADGTYTGTGNRDLDFNGKAITVKSENGPTGCVIDCQGSYSDEHRGFYFHNSEGNDSTVKGFTIRNGYWIGWDGGGIYCSNSSPRLMNNIITGNYAGGGLSNGGGGIACLGGAPLIAGNTITGNWCFQWGGGIRSVSSGTIIGNTITGNSAMLYGGGIVCRGSETIRNNIISGNSASGEGYTGDGGGIFIYGGSPTIENNTIINNSAHFVGGGICGWADSSSSVTIINNIIAGNRTSQLNGGGIHFSGSGGGTVTIRNNTITGNEAGYNSWPGLGAGIYCEGSSPVITNTIIWANTPDQIYGSPDVTYSNVQGGYAGIGNFDADPFFVTGPFGDYYLAQKPAYQLRNSPCVDAGDPGSDMMEGTTRTDSVQDTGTIDVGYHYPAYYLAGYRVTPMVGTENTFFTYSVDVTTPEDETFEGVYVGIDYAYLAEMSLGSGTPGEGTYTYATHLEGAGYHQAIFYLNTVESLYLLPIYSMRTFHYPLVVDLNEVYGDGLQIQVTE